MLILSCNGVRVPFHVGQTGRLLRRIEDYQCREFGACTDFRIGEAIKYLSETRQCGIELRFKQSQKRQKGERDLIRELLLADCPLLNHLSAYDYKVANREEEIQIIARFCEMILWRNGLMDHT